MAKPFKTDCWFQYPTFRWNKKHAVVIGAGIAGCQMTWHLVQQGWQVTLIERDMKIARQASGNPAGIISPKMTAQASIGEDFYVSCFGYTIQQLSQFKERHHQLEWHQCGLLQLAHNDRESQRWESLNNRVSAKEFEHDFLRCLDQQQSSAIAGIPINFKASYFPKAGWINPASYCEILLADCGSYCKLILETDVISLEKQQETWLIQNSQNQPIASAEAVIITSGKDLNQFPQTNNLPTMPVAGQTTSTPATAYSKQLKTTIGHEGYLTPVSNTTSQLTFGASFERNIDVAELNTETDKTNLQQLSKYLPQFADSFEEVKSAHVAIRMTTPDRFPYVGGIADVDFYAENYADLHQGKQFKEYPSAEYIDGLFVLAGLGSRGLTTSGLCAKILSDILNNDSQLENQSIQQHSHPARFIIKNLKRKKAITKEH